MNNHPHLRRAACFASLPLALLVAHTNLIAADRTWDGDASPNGNWSVSANWDGDATVPVNGDNLVFGGLTLLDNTNNLSGLSVGWLRFDAGGFNLWPGSALTLTGITNTSGANNVRLPLILGGASAFASAGAGNVLGILGAVTNGGNALTLAGDGDFTLGAAVTGAGSLIMNGTGTASATANQPLTGGVIVNSGTFRVAVGNFGGAFTPSLITVNTNGTLLGNGTHATGGNTSMRIDRGTWLMNAEDYKQNLTLIDGTISEGPSPTGAGGQLRVGFAGGGGTWTWFVTNSVSGSVINAQVSTISAAVNLILDVARGAAPQDLTINGPIIQAGSVTFARNGITRLTAINTHTGVLNINGGTVELTGSIETSSAINVASNAVLDASSTFFQLGTGQTLAGRGTVLGTVNDNNPGAAISPGAVGAAGTLMLQGLNLSGNLTLNFDLANVTTVGGGTNDLLVVTNLTLSSFATNTVNFGFLSGTPLVPGTYTLIQFVSGPPAGPVTTLAATASRYTYVFTNDGSAIKVIVNGAPAPLVWRGDGVLNNWDIGVSSNWINGMVFDAFLQGDNATFNDTGSNTPAINLVGNLQPVAVNVNATKDYTFAGAGRITGGARLVKTNSGTLTVLTDNDYTGGTTVSGGLLQIGAGGATGGLGGGSGTNNTRIVIDRTGTMTSAASLAGTGSLVKRGTSTVNLTGTNTFTGGTLVQQGILQIGNNPPEAGASVAGTITNHANLYYGRNDAFTLANPVTSAGNPGTFGAGSLFLRTPGGMTVNATAGIDLGGDLSVSQDTAGRLLVAPGGNVNLGGEMLVGNPTGISGQVDQTGGNLNLANRVRLGHWGSAFAVYNLSGGTLNVGNTLNVGWDGVGVFNLTGGIVNCLTLAVDGNGATGAIGGTNETFNLLGGRINIGSGGIFSAGGGGGYNINLGGGTLAATANWTSTNDMFLTGSTPVTVDTVGNTITLSGILSGTNGLVKQGTGALNLNGVSTYTGPTTVAQGVLQGSGTLASAVTVQSGATLSAGTTGGTGTLRVNGTVTADAGAGFRFDLSSTAATSDLIVAGGALNLNNNPVTLNFLGGVPFVGTPYTLVSNFGVRSGALNFVNASRYAPTLDQTGPNRITLLFTGTNASLVWRGDVNNLWNVNTDNNWRNAGVADKFFQWDRVIFDDTRVSPNVVLATDVAPQNVTFNASGNYSLSGAGLTGAGSLLKSGTGTLTLSNTLAHTGGTTVNGGTLQIGGGGTAGAVSGNIANNASVVFNRSDAVTYAGVISGAGTLTQAGAGTLTLTGNSTHTGGTTVNAGRTLQVGAGLGSGAVGTGTLTVPATASVIFDRNDSPTIAHPIAGAGALTFKGPGSTGAGSGQGSFNLTGVNSFSGTISLVTARLQVGNPAALGAVASISVPSGSTLWVPQAATFTPTLSLAGSGWGEGGGLIGALRLGSGAIWAGNITLAGSTRISAFTDANDNRITGTISGGANVLDVGSPGGAAGVLTLAPSSPNTFGGLVLSPGTLIAGNANALPNNLPLTLNGGVLRLNGLNRTFNSINFTALSSLQNGSATADAQVTLVVPPGANTYNVTNADGGSRPIHVTLTQTLPWTMAFTQQHPLWTGNFTNNGGTITCNLQNTGFGSQSAPGRFIVVNNGALVTTNNNLLNGYSGSVILNNSTWYNNRYVSFASALGSLTLNNSTITGTNTTDGTGFQSMRLPSTVVVSGSAPSFLRGVNAGGNAGYGLATTGNTTFNVADVTGNANPDLIVNQVLYGGASQALIKTGAGTLEIDTAATYTGSTLINAGTLKLTGAGSLASSPTKTIASGATFDVSAVGGLNLLSGHVLSGSGTVVGTVNDGNGTLRPGTTAAGTLTINGNLTVGGSGALDYELANVTTLGGGVNDLIQVNGDVSVNDASPTPVKFTFLNGAPTTGQYTLIKYTGTLTGNPAVAFTAPAGYTATFTHNVAAKEVRVSFTVPAQNLVWEGGSGNVWNTDVTSTEWFNGAVNTNFYQLDTVTFNDSRTTVNTTVSLTEPVTPQSVVVNSTNDYTFADGGGRLTGNTSITKQNTNTLTVSTANDFTGPIHVQGGVFKLGNANTLPIGTTVNIAAGGALDFAGFPNNNTRGYTFNIAGSGPDGAGALNNTGGGIFSFASVSNLNLTANATVGGSGRWDIGTGAAGPRLDGGGNHLTKTGTMSMSMRPQTITNLASLTVAQGILYYENFDQTNAWTTSTTNYVKAGATLGSLTRQINMPVVLEGGTLRSESGVATWLGPVVVASNSIVANNLSQILGGVVSGPGEVLVTGGSGVLFLTNANTWTGGLVLSNGFTSVNGSTVGGAATLLLSHPSALGSGPLTIHGGAVTNNTITNTLRAVEFDVTGAAVVPNDINLPTALITNVSLVGRDNTSIFTLAGKISGGHSSLTNWIDFGVASPLGVIRLSNPANDFVVGRTLLNRGTLALAANNVLGNPANPLHIAGTLRLDAPALSVANPIAVLGTSTLQLLGDNNGDGTPDTVNNVTLSGVLSGSGLLNIRGTNGVLTLTGVNTYANSLELVEPVTLQVADVASLGSGAVALKAGTLRYTGLGSQTTTRTLWNDNAALTGATIDVVNASASLTWNPGGGTCNQILTKTGPGSLTMGSLALNGPLVMNGGVWTVNSSVGGSSVTVNSGALNLNGTVAAACPVTVNSGGTLGGTGTINGTATVNAGGTLAPGNNGLGNLNVNTLILGGTTRMEIDGTAVTSDSVSALASVTYGGSLVVTNIGGAPVAGNKFFMFNGASRQGAFATVTLPTLPGGLSWQNNLALDGSIEVVSGGVNPNPTNIVAVVSGSNLDLSWPASHIGWELQVQTNARSVGLTMPTNTWFAVPGSTATNAVSIPVDKANGTVFFRLRLP